MKALLMLISFFAVSAQATVDMQGQATIVVENYHEENYFLQTVPTDYCIGIPTQALAMAITQPVTIKSGYGCGGGMDFESQVNAATCAQILVEETDDWKKVKVKIDVSNCGDKASNKDFMSILRQAVVNSYRSNGFEIIELL